VDERKQFDEFIYALTTLGFDARERRGLFRVLKGILLLGNVQFR